MPMSSVLTSTFATDAHFAAYSELGVPRRLSKDAVYQLPDGVAMVAAVFDRDCAEVHGSPQSAPESWRGSERDKFLDLLHDHSGLFSYDTRGGDRIIGLLASPVHIRTAEDAAEWARWYVACARYLERRYGIVVDPSCKDWQRLFRAPHATRNKGGLPEDRATTSNADAIGIWSPELAPEDWPPAAKKKTAPAQPRAATSTSTSTNIGVLHKLLSSRGDVGDELEPGMYACRCPKESEHTVGETFDGSTVLFDPAGDDKIGYIHCRHKHGDPDYREVLALFNEDEQRTAGWSPKTKTVEGILTEAGLNALTTTASHDEVGSVLERLTLLLQGESAALIALVRDSAVAALGKVDAVSGPAKVVDAHLNSVAAQASDAPTARVVFPEPEPWPEPVDGGALIEDLAATFTRFVVLPSRAAVALAFWVLHTYAIAAAQITPRLSILSPTKRCGKSTVLKLLGALVRRPLPTANVTTAVVFRIVEADQPTLLIDEADTFLKEREELRGIINAGHDRASAIVLRCEGDDHEPTVFKVFAPIAIAAIGTLPDTILDRSIVIRMKRRARTEKVARFRRRERDALAELPRRCARWAQDHLPELHDADGAAPDALNDRAADNWESLLAIAHAAGGDWLDRARQTALLLSGEPADGEVDSSTLAEQLLSDIRAVFDTAAVDRLATKDLLKALAELEGRPWEESNHGRPISSRQLGGLLRRFNIASGTIRIGGGGDTPKGYLLDDFADAFERYLPPAPHSESATSATRAKPNGD